MNYRTWWDAWITFFDSQNMSTRKSEENWICSKSFDVDGNSLMKLPNKYICLTVKNIKKSSLVVGFNGRSRVTCLNIVSSIDREQQIGWYWSHWNKVLKDMSVNKKRISSKKCYIIQNRERRWYFSYYWIKSE